MLVYFAILRVKRKTGDRVRRGISRTIFQVTALSVHHYALLTSRTHSALVPSQKVFQKHLVGRSSNMFVVFGMQMRQSAKAYSS